MPRAPRTASLRLASLLTVSLSLVAGPAMADPGNVMDTVRAYYVPMIWNPLEVEGFAGVAEPALSILRKNEEQQKGGEAGCITFVPTIDGQDYDNAEIDKTLKVEDTGKGEDGAKVIAATFTLFQEPRRVLWTMVEEEGVWKVSDIASETTDWRLSEFLCE